MWEDEGEEHAVLGMVTYVYFGNGKRWDLEIEDTEGVTVGGRGVWDDMICGSYKDYERKDHKKLNIVEQYSRNVGISRSRRNHGEDSVRLVVLCPATLRLLPKCI